MMAHPISVRSALLRPLTYAMFCGIVWAVSSRSSAQLSSDVKTKKNVIRGTVVAGSASRPVEGAIAIAYDENNKAISRSDPTSADGIFELIVPDTIGDFQLAVHDKQIRYWDYKPNDPLENKSHPHDVGRIELNDKHDLSLLEVQRQVESASLLHEVGEDSAGSLLDKLGKSYFRDGEINTKKGCISIGDGLLVKWQRPEAGKGKLADVALIQPQPSDVNADLRAEQQIALDRVGMRLIVERMRNINKVEQEYNRRVNAYGNSQELVRAGLIDERDFLTPAGCVDVLPGTLHGKKFFQKDEGPYDYYLLISSPSVDIDRDDVDGGTIDLGGAGGRFGIQGSRPGVKEYDERPIEKADSNSKVGERFSEKPVKPSSSVVLLSGPDGVIRYIAPGDTLTSLGAAKPVGKDFPLGITVAK